MIPQPEDACNHGSDTPNGAIANRHRPWPLGLAAREGLATAKSGRWTSLLLVVTLTWLFAVPGAADALAITRLIEGEERWIGAGAFVFVVTGADDENPTTIPVGVCDRLAGSTGVLASFAAVRSSQPASLGHIPGARISQVNTSPGAAAFLGTTTTADTVLITAALAERTGIADGEPVVLDLEGAPAKAGTTRGVATARVVDSAVMGAEYDGAVLVPDLLTSLADTCFVRTDASHVSAVREALPSLLQHEGDLAIANPRLAGGEFNVDYTTAFEDRPLRWAWIAAAALASLLWALVQWFRRSQVAIYATFGMRAHSRLVMQVAEWSTVALAAGMWAWPIGTLGAVAFGSRPDIAAIYVGAHTVLSLLLATAVVVILGLRPTGTLLNALKER